MDIQLSFSSEGFCGISLAHLRHCLGHSRKLKHYILHLESYKKVNHEGDRGKCWSQGQL